MSTLRLRPGESPSRSFDQASWWGPYGRGEDRLSIVDLIRAGTLDAELAALLWLLVEARLPVVVAAGPQLAGKTTLLTALLDFLPPEIRRIQLRGFAEDFGWLPEADRLGWLTTPIDAWRTRSAIAGVADGPDGADGTATGVQPSSAFLLASELSPHLPFYTWGEHARVAVRATSLGYGLGATIHADSLEEVFDELTGPDVGLTDDELSHLGIVLILRILHPERSAREPLRRVVAAHFLRPVARDAGGHVQRLPPAVLATHDRASDGLEHFAWGVVPELALRTGRRAGDFEAEQARRSDLLNSLAAAGVTSVIDIRNAVLSYRLSTAGHHHSN